MDFAKVYKFVGKYHIAVIICTSFSDPSGKERERERGGNDTLCLSNTRNERLSVLSCQGAGNSHQ